MLTHSKKKKKGFLLEKGEFNLICYFMIENFQKALLKVFSCQNFAVEKSCL